jgi:hypothetical protein
MFGGDKTGTARARHGDGRSDKAAAAIAKHRPARHLVFSADSQDARRGSGKHPVRVTPGAGAPSDQTPTGSHRSRFQGYPPRKRAARAPPCFWMLSVGAAQAASGSATSTTVHAATRAVTAAAATSHARFTASPRTVHPGARAVATVHVSLSVSAIGNAVAPMPPSITVAVDIDSYARPVAIGVVIIIIIIGGTVTVGAGRTVSVTVNASAAIFSVAIPTRVCRRCRSNHRQSSEANKGCFHSKLSVMDACDETPLIY